VSLARGESGAAPALNSIAPPPLPIRGHTAPCLSSAIWSGVVG
jgi:hypothetical protein